MYVEQKSITLLSLAYFAIEAHKKVQMPIPSRLIPRIWNRAEEDLYIACTLYWCHESPLFLLKLLFLSLSVHDLGIQNLFSRTSQSVLKSILNSRYWGHARRADLTFFKLFPSYEKRAENDWNHRSEHDSHCVSLLSIKKRFPQWSVMQIDNYNLYNRLNKLCTSRPNQ